jgi:hypothetical protein
MGHIFSSSRFNISLPIQKVFDDDEWRDAIIKSNNTSIQTKDINFLQNAEISDTNKYIIKVDSEIPSEVNMVLCFPMHPDANKRLLWTKEYIGHMNAMSIQINERIQQSNRSDINACLFSIACADNFYRFYGFYGKLYLFWAQRLNIERENSLENDIQTTIPLLIETNDNMQFKNCYLFSTETCIPIKNIISFIEPIDANIFCCENDPRYEKTTQKSDHVKSITSNTATQISDVQVIESLKDLSDEDEPFFK